MDLQSTIKMAINNGATVATSGFSGTIPPKEVVVLEKGDVFNIPENSPVYNVPIRGRKDADGNPITFEAVFANLKKKNGTETSIAISPSVFSRSAMSVNKDTKQEIERVSASGTACDEFYKHEVDGLNAAMKAIEGKDIEVADVKSVFTYNEAFMTRPQRRSFHTLNFK